MHKAGEVRSDGKVFLSYQKGCKNGERWVTMNQFLKTKGFDWYERRLAMDKNVADRANKKAEVAQRKIKMELTKEQRDKERKERKREYARKAKAKLRSENPKKARELDRIYRERHKNNPDLKLKRKKTQLKYYIKTHPNWKPKEERLKESLKRKQERQELAAVKKAAKEEAMALKLAMLAAKPKRIVLTEEQRKERKRQEKRNYKHTRRARMNNCEVRTTPQMVAEARKSAGDRCYYCSKKSKLTLDHFEPLSKGGAHCVSNFVFACLSCNSRKRDLDPFDFMAANVASWL